MEESTVLARTTTNLPPCCLRIFKDEFVIIGTYELNKESGFRTGSIDAYDKHLTNLLVSIPTYGAILDLKFSPFDEGLLATAHSTGNVMLWRVASDKGLEIKPLQNLQVCETECLITSLHFSPTDSNTILITSTYGDFATIDLASGNITLQIESSVSKSETSKLDSYTVQGNTIQAFDFQQPEKKLVFSFEHSLECWTGEFGHLSPLQSVVFTGGDDSTIAAHDLRSGDNIWSNARLHEAGVVAIKASTETFRRNKPTSLVTGSYDDHIRSFDLRMFTEKEIYPGQNVPVLNKIQEDLGGGVWRFSEAPDNDGALDNRLMVCCMYNGAKVVSVNDQNFSTESYIKQGHDSMCYGGDWSKNLLVTCSFYDKSLQSWRP